MKAMHREAAVPQLEDQARSVFFAALEHAPDQWRVFLAEVCGEDAELRARVEHLLRGHQEMGSIHRGGQRADRGKPEEERPFLGATIDDPTAIDRPGTLIGPYKLLEQIGEGGFGVVFLA